MVNRAELIQEIVVTVVNKIGVLADASKIIAEQGVSIIGVTGYTEEKTATLILATSDNPRSLEALKKAGYKSSRQEEAVMVELEDKPGALENLTVKLAKEELDIKHIYGTTSPSGCPARIILCASDNKKALAVLKG